MHNILGFVLGRKYRYSHSSLLGGNLKIGDLVHLSGTKSWLLGIIMTADVDYSEIFWNTGTLSWEYNRMLEVIK